MVKIEETTVPEIKPYGFTLEFVDDKGNTLSDVSFQVSVDQGSPDERETDEKGIIKVQKPKGEINLKFKGVTHPNDVQ
jgi:hypothetical protein